MFLFFLSVFSFAGVQAFPCNKYWPPGSPYTVNSQCYLYSGYPYGGFAQNPQIIYNVNVTLAVTQSLQSNSGYVNTAAGQIQQALTDTIWQYEDLQDVFSDIVFVLTDLTDPDPAFPNTKAATVRPAGNTGACQIVVYQPWASLDDDFRRQALAHELYHCVQQTMILENGENGVGSGWWMDGSASFFSNVVYPEYNLEWDHDENYHPDQPIYNEADPYSAELYFQALANSIGPTYVNNWILAQTFTSTSAAERTRLSTDANFADDFHLFAQQFTLGTIYDTDRELMNIANPVLPDIASLVTTSDTDGTISLIVDTFTISEFQFTLGPAQTVTITYDAAAKANVRVSYKQEGDTVWTSMPDGPITGAAGDLVLPCDDGNPITVFILVTSTDDTDKEAVTVSLAQVYADDTCQQCLPGGTPTLRGCTTPSPTPTPIAITVPIPTPTPTPPLSSPTNAPGSCTAASSIKPDPCLVGPTWNLDLASTKSLMLQHLATSDPSATINSLLLSGSGTLQIQNTNATYKYTNLVVDLDISVEGIDVPTNTVVNGAMEADLYIQSGGSGSGAFCMDVYSGDGSVVETDPITGGFTIDIGADWITATVSIQYNCAPGLLTMQGSMNGNSAWGPYAYTS